VISIEFFFAERPIYIQIVWANTGYICLLTSDPGIACVVKVLACADIRGFFSMCMDGFDVQMAKMSVMSMHVKHFHNVCILLSAVLTQDDERMISSCRDATNKREFNSLISSIPTI
jgi:hypothetical protein